MAVKKMPISLFVAELEAALKREDGYIMGAKGQDPKTLNDWYFEQYADRDEYSEKQEKKALYWRDHAQRVWDCNGLAEGIYQDYTGVNINTKARYNYAEWCDPKGTGMIPPEYRVPGAAVFTGEKASRIPHVMFLYKPVESDKPEGDWYLIEARGVTYGVVKTRLLSRKPTFWGLMTKYFDYSVDQPLVPDSAPGQRMVEVKGIGVNIRVGDSTEYKSVGKLNTGARYPYVATSTATGWHAMRVDDQIVWISDEYSKLT